MDPTFKSNNQHQRSVRFAPTPQEQRLRAAAAALRRALLVALFWPLILPWRAALLGERLTAKGLGVYLGLLQASWGSPWEQPACP